MNELAPLFLLCAAPLAVAFVLTLADWVMRKRPPKVRTYEIEEETVTREGWTEKG
jgi:hypothetical protein